MSGGGERGCVVRARERGLARWLGWRVAARVWIVLCGVHWQRMLCLCGGACALCFFCAACHSVTCPTPHPTRAAIPRSRQASLRPQAEGVRWPDQTRLPQEGVRVNASTCVCEYVCLCVCVCACVCAHIKGTRVSLPMFHSLVSVGSTFDRKRGTCARSLNFRIRVGCVTKGPLQPRAPGLVKRTHSAGSPPDCTQ